MTAQQVRVLCNVVDVARIELRDMDEDDLPSRLRKVAKNSARVLPTPFAQSILKEILLNERFRDAVLSRWQDEGLDDPIGLAYLKDPVGSQDLVVRTDLEREISLRESEAKSHVLRITSLEGQLREAKRRLKADRDDHVELISRLGARDEEKRKSLLRSKREAEAARDDAQKALETSEQTIRSLRAELADAAERMRRGLEREKRKATSSVEPRGDQRPLPPSDPVAFAAWLDAVERIQRPYRDAERLESLSPKPELFEIPDGISPDDRRAVEALIAQRPRVIVIDGYNVAGLLPGETLASASNRASVISKAERLSFASGASVIVVFDAEGSGSDDARAQFLSPGGVEVRFSMTESADDYIVDLILSDSKRSVLVTNDRELRERCLVDGCVPVWSSAFVDWSIH
ncbi:MAG: hypothetical protein BMS9Abin17_0079 [Acidimicrobiia bacterium]|nr:MAG: hypothetical protein BMS9Abin17_0079 [Acidimicrobiia bacterium]